MKLRCGWSIFHCNAPTFQLQFWKILRVLKMHLKNLWHWEQTTYCEQIFSSYSKLYYHGFNYKYSWNNYSKNLETWGANVEKRADFYCSLIVLHLAGWCQTKNLIMINLSRKLWRILRRFLIFWWIDTNGLFFSGECVKRRNLFGISDWLLISWMKIKIFFMSLADFLPRLKQKI